MYPKPLKEIPIFFFNRLPESISCSVLQGRNHTQNVLWQHLHQQTPSMAHVNIQAHWLKPLTPLNSSLGNYNSIETTGWWLESSSLMFIAYDGYNEPGPHLKSCLSVKRNHMQPPGCQKLPAGPTLPQLQLSRQLMSTQSPTMGKHPQPSKGQAESWWVPSSDICPS